MENPLKFDPKRSRVKFCPCGKKNNDGKFAPFKGFEDKGHCHSCGKTFHPGSVGGDEIQQHHGIEKKTDFSISFRKTATADITEVFFTEIKVFQSNAEGVLNYLNLIQLAERLNSFRKEQGGKSQNPAILKGIFEGGTSGEFCTKPAPFLFFDIDVKDTENPELRFPEENKAVFDFMKKRSVLIWHSNSGLGIAGILHIPQFASINKHQPEKHLAVSKSIFSFLSAEIEKETGLKVKFDFQQGKFRQIRYLAEQRQPAKLNPESYLFEFYEFSSNPKKIAFIPQEYFKKLRNERNNQQNHFNQWLVNKERGEYAFGAELVSKLSEAYQIASYSKDWMKDWILFPYIDIEGNIRDIKVMDYNPSTGKRIAEKNGDSGNRCLYIGKKLLKELGIEDPNLKKCFFGEHNLKGNSKAARIFESEATAIYAAAFFPEDVCLATGGKEGCKWYEKAVFSVLKGRKAILHPDIDAHEEWVQKAEGLKIAGFDVAVSKTIIKAAEKYSQQHGIEYSELVKQKFDLRDILKFQILPATKANPAPKQKAAPEPLPPKPVMPLPTAEDITFSKMVAKQPKLEQFAAMFDLVSLKTGKPFQIVPIEADQEQSEPPAEPVQASTEEEPTEEDIRRLDAIAGRILMPLQGYKAEEVQQLMQAKLKISSDRAKAGFQKMFAFGVIETRVNGFFYLKDSTPF